MSHDFFIAQIKQRFPTQSLVTRDELYSFYKQFEPDLKNATFAWRIYDLKQKNLLNPIKKGVYSLSVKARFHPHIEPRIKDISTKISKHFTLAKYCIWHSRWLNEWMVHQPGRFNILVEVEPTASESVFFFLKDESFKNVYYKPDDYVLDRYVSEQMEAIIVKPLISKSPLQKEKKIPIPAIEKILVDLLVEKQLFASYQGAELVNIYNNVYKSYSINITKLLAYAKRRAKENEVRDFITNNTRLTEILNT